MSHDLTSHTKNYLQPQNTFTISSLFLLLLFLLLVYHRANIIIVVVDFKISKLEIRARETTLGMMFLEANAHIPCHIKNFNYVYILLLNTCWSFDKAFNEFVWTEHFLPIVYCIFPIFWRWYTVFYQLFDMELDDLSNAKYFLQIASIIILKFSKISLRVFYLVYDIV